jgi:hypothetical protein
MRHLHDYHLHCCYSSYPSPNHSDREWPRCLFEGALTTITSFYCYGTVAHSSSSQELAGHAAAFSPATAHYRSHCG